jgi:prepilin-type N-terminal cleavage/methylation domain-containing protein
MNKLAGVGSVGVPASAGLYGYSKCRLKPGLQRGFTLVEMLAVVATGSVLLVIAMGVVHRAMRLESQWQSQANVNRALARLAHDFRADVHQCQDMQLTENPSSLKLTSSDETVITYEIAAEEIIRDFQSPGAQRRREFYAKAADYQAAFTIDDEPQWVELRVTRNLRLKGVEPRVLLHVAAEAGRLNRLAESPGGTP